MRLVWQFNTGLHSALRQTKDTFLEDACALKGNADADDNMVRTQAKAYHRHSYLPPPNGIHGQSAWSLAESLLFGHPNKEKDL